jgi:LysR family glycine cleavage system transcriptional activator
LLLQTQFSDKICAENAQVLPMSRTLPPLNALRAFEAAGRHESFSRAADELGVSHSSISRHVRGLEQRLGVQLFRDAKRGVVLTAEGSHYLQRIGPAFDVIDAATEGLADQPAGRVTINSEPVFAAKVIVPLLNQFHNTFPEIELRLVASNEIADLDRYEADLAVRYARTGVVDGPSDLISDAPIYPYSAPGLLPQDRIAPHHLTEFRLYRDRTEDIWQLWCDLAQFDVVLPPQDGGRLRAPLVQEAAIHGAGLFMAGSDCAAQDVALGRLVQLSDVGLRLGAFRLLASGQSARRKAVRRVRSWLLDQTQQLRGA